MKRIEMAEQLALKAHEGQVRKLSGEPYIVHPIAVANILKEAGFPEDVIIAGYLHDTIEDTDLDFIDIEKAFGKNVTDLVRENTEDKSKTWPERKQHTVEAIRTAPLEVKALIIADKLDNFESLKESFEQDGDDIWNKFKGDKQKQSWYYRSVAANALEGLDQEEIPEFFYTYKKMVDRFFV
ncbi:HD domain-containing protein [Pseudalkalibacillus salsuginis]|uniref:HD domain-containing protein n=1 Tax=Pseudalkalibacillus salsuginis TaxID=2910972 RepID=UPI001F4041D1|nr:HD domain-containing protein [Pseudalkalibacillus salsuginis]MCF6408861.1 HD domain-containing protein [Pseudalkalibacillus salsuginis]